MRILVISHDEVKQLLRMNDCVELMSRTLATLARDQAINPLRQGMWLPEKVGVLGMMPAALLADPQLVGIKVITVFPGNHGTDYDCHQGAVMIFDTTHGRPLAIVDASAITEIRTAAVSAVATQALARPDAHVLTILGSGVQARSHLLALAESMDIRDVRVWSRNRDRAQKLVDTVGPQLSSRPTMTVAQTVQAAVEGSEIICTTTASADPVLLGEWLENGQHINAVGASVAFARELDTGAVVRSKLYVDRRESAENEAGEFLSAKRDGALDETHIRGDLGQVLIGELPGRESADEITLFKSLGLAVEDLASAHHVFVKAQEQGIGSSVEL